MGILWIWRLHIERGKRRNAWSERPMDIAMIIPQDSRLVAEGRSNIVELTPSTRVRNLDAWIMFVRLLVIANISTVLLRDSFGNIETSSYYGHKDVLLPS